MYLNKAILIGNLTRDPELRALPSGVQVASFSIATNRVWKDKNNQKQESADYHNIVVFGKQAESSAQYLKKGSQVLIEGRMQTRSWDKDGVKQYRMEIVADRVQFGTKSTVIGKGNTVVGEGTVIGNNNVVIGDIDYPTEEASNEDIPF